MVGNHQAGTDGEDRQRGDRQKGRVGPVGAWDLEGGGLVRFDVHVLLHVRHGRLGRVSWALLRSLLYAGPALTFE